MKKLQQLWIGTTESRKRLARLFAEEYRKDEPISEFARTQEVDFYDHDFLECHRVPIMATDARVLLAGLSFARSFIDVVAPAISHLMPANTAVSLHDHLLEAPRSTSGPGFHLEYAGTFSYDRNAHDPVVPAPVPPQRVTLRLRSGGPVSYQGNVVKRIAVNSSGLVIGSGEVQTDRPYLDLSYAAGARGLAPRQVSIYPDAFQQWILEDHGGNSLTRIDGVVLNRERTFPWHGNVITLGGVALEWLCPKGRPGAAA